VVAPRIKKMMADGEAQPEPLPEARVVKKDEV
jgi:hypothetical protein